MRRVAIYGGSFDPPHVCHVLVATYVLCRGNVDEVRIVPVYTHAFGKTLSPFSVRCQMLEAALQHLGPQVTIDPIEEELGGTNYTIDTVGALLAKEPDIKLTFVCGTDLFEDRFRWKEWDKLRELMDFLVIGRGADPEPSTDRLPVRLPDVSSTAVRQTVAEGGSIAHLVSQGVENIIREQGLYLS
jgi:nicotinate-nucleotide adenylyltransferase